MRGRAARIFWLFRRECLSMAVTPSTYVAVTLFVIIVSLGFYLSTQENNAALFEPVAVFINFLCIFFMPLITMRLFSEERKNGTIETLMTAPVTLFDVIVSKLSAAYLFYLIMISPCAIFIVLLMWAGDIDSGAVLTSMLGLLCVGGVYVSAGILVSSVTRSQIAAAMGAMGLIFIFWALWFFGDMSSLSGRFIRYLSLKDHFDYSLAKGVLDTADLIYFISVTGFFVFINYILLNGSLSVRPGEEATKSEAKVKDAVFVFLFIELTLLGIAYSHINQIGMAVISNWWVSENYSSLSVALLPFLSAVVLMAVFVYIKWSGRKSFVLSILRQRDLSGVLLGIVSVLLLVVNLNVLSARYVYRVDISEQKINTLDIATRSALDKLQAPVRILVFFSAYNDQYENFPILEKTRSLLFEYSSYSSKVLVDYYNPDLMPAVCREIASEKGLDFSRLSNFALVEYQGRRALVPWDFIAQQQVNIMGQKYREFNGETTFTTAIKRVMDPRMPVIYLTEEHGEFDSYSKEEASRSVTNFASELRMEGFKVKRFPFSGGIDIPDDCDLLVMPGPNRPFTAAEIAALRKYIENGGRALVMLEPPLGAGLHTGLEELFAGWGAKINDDILFDPKNNIGGSGGNILAAGNPSHRITASSRRVICFIRRGRSLGVRSGGKVKKGWKGTYILTSSENSISYAVDKDSGNDGNRSGGFACGLALEGDGKSRVVLLGDTDIASNIDLGKWHNRGFLLSSVQWLLDRDDYKIQIPERQEKNRTLNLTAFEQRVFFWISLVALPQLALIIGGLIWWLRKQ